MVPWDDFAKAASFEPCSWATLAMVGRVEAEMRRLQQVVPGWGKLTSPNLAAYLLILAETTSFFPPQGSASLLDVGRRPWEGAPFTAGVVQKAMPPALPSQPALPRRNEWPRYFFLLQKKVPLALPKAKAAACRPGWERNLTEWAAVRAGSCTRDKIHPTAARLIHLGIFLSLHHPSSTGKLISSLDPIKNNILLIAG